MEACGVEVVEAQTFPESADTLLRSDAYFWGRAARDLGCIAIISGDTGKFVLIVVSTDIGELLSAQHGPDGHGGVILSIAIVLVLLNLTVKPFNL